MAGYTSGADPSITQEGSGLVVGFNDLMTEEEQDCGHLDWTLASRSTDRASLFFFFIRSLKPTTKPRALLRDWMDQLLMYSPPLQEQLMTHVRRAVY